MRSATGVLLGEIGTMFAQARELRLLKEAALHGALTGATVDTDGGFVSRWVRNFG